MDVGQGSYPPQEVTSLQKRKSLQSVAARKRQTFNQAQTHQPHENNELKEESRTKKIPPTPPPTKGGGKQRWFAGVTFVVSAAVQQQ
jgi:hypothetical protein